MERTVKEGDVVNVLLASGIAVTNHVVTETGDGWFDLHHVEAKRRKLAPERIEWVRVKRLTVLGPES